MGWPEMATCLCISLPPRPNLDCLCAVQWRSCGPRLSRGRSSPGGETPLPSVARVTLTAQAAGWMPHQRPSSCASRSNPGRSPSTPLAVESPCVMDFQPVFPGATERSQRQRRGPYRQHRHNGCSVPMREANPSHLLACLGEWSIRPNPQRVAPRWVRQSMPPVP
jgi:hypothetical protein